MSFNSSNISNYNIEKILGKGAFSTVYLATKKDTQQKVALKEMSQDLFKDPEARQSIENEINICSKLENTNIVKMLDIVDSDNKIYISYEHCNGGDLRKYMNYFKGFNETIIQRIMIQILNGLEELHKKKVIHHDIKPENILIQFFYDKNNPSEIEERLNKINNILENVGVQNINNNQRNNNPNNYNNNANYPYNNYVNNIPNLNQQNYANNNNNNNPNGNYNYNYNDRNNNVNYPNNNCQQDNNIYYNNQNNNMNNFNYQPNRYNDGNNMNNRNNMNNNMYNNANNYNMNNHANNNINNMDINNSSEYISNNDVYYYTNKNNNNMNSNMDINNNINNNMNNNMNNNINNNNNNNNDLNLINRQNSDEILTKDDIMKILIERTEYKLSDFGLSKLSNDIKERNLSGSPLYMSPESFDPNSKIIVIENDIIDIWALGVLAFELFFGRRPFEAFSIEQLQAMYKNGEYYIDLEGGKISKQFFSFLHMCLQKDPKNRATVRKLKDSKFINDDEDSFSKLDENELVELLKNYTKIVNKKHHIFFTINKKFFDDDY